MNLSLTEWAILLYWWYRQYPVTDVAEEAQVSKNIAIQAYRDVCSWKLVNVIHHSCLAGLELWSRLMNLCDVAMHLVNMVI